MNTDNAEPKHFICFSFNIDIMFWNNNGTTYSLKMWDSKRWLIDDSGILPSVFQLSLWEIREECGLVPWIPHGLRSAFPTEKGRHDACAFQGLGPRTPSSTAPGLSDKPTQDQQERTQVYSSEGRRVVKRTRVHGQQPALVSRSGRDVILDLPAQETLQIKAAR